MKFSLVVCTYQRPQVLGRLLESVEEQTVYPDQILIIDGSKNNETKQVLEQKGISNLEYFLVSPENRGLTRQRNYGISKAAKDIQIVCFLDDDVVLASNYFENLIKTYKEYPQALGVGGYINNEANWKKKPQNLALDEFEYDGWVRKLGSRNVLRKKLGLLSNETPGRMPDFSHGLSTGFLPPSGKIYEVDFLMGCAMSFKKEVFNDTRFSTYFEGYGLYEDMDFCLRVSQKAPLFLNTSAQLEHFHEPSGRPNKFKYGKMVIRNGWYVWRVKYPSPKFKARLKWHSTALLLTLVRMGNILSTPKRKEACMEFLGRVSGWWSLIWKKPELTKDVDS